MNRRNQFFDKIIKNFDKVSDAEKKRIIERLALLSNSQNIIIENLEEGIIAIDINGIIQGINKKACFLLSIPRNSEDKSISKCINNTDIGRLILELLESNNTDTKIIKDDKNERMLQIDILPLGDSGIIIGTLIKIFDITKSYESACSETQTC